MQPLLHFTPAASHYHRHRQLIRTFINARIKWVRDPYLDTAIEKEKNLKPLLLLKTLIISQPFQTIPLSTVSPLKPHLHLPTTAQKFIEKYPSIFKMFLPPGKTMPLPHVKLTPKALSLHHEETLMLRLSHYRKDVAERLAKLLMLARGLKIPLDLIDLFKYDLGLPHDYLLTLLPEFPEYFQISDMGFRDSSGNVVLVLDLVSWRKELAISAMEKRAQSEGESKSRVKFLMNLPRGFDLEKRVMEWVEDWQNLPYISPYENAFHLVSNSDQAEKWAVGVIHELLSLLLSKKTERENIFRLGEFLGFTRLRFKKALVHFPGIFYVSNKIRMQTVFLREKYKKNLLIERHPLMGMRYKYINLMNRVLRRGKPIRSGFVGRKKGNSLSKGGRRKGDDNRYSIDDENDE
ncbi:protein WHAT'S THIS FACTOR 1 homolog [Olea europaea var. sylvestris]|uniref:protein WHAT'S THIS FACTOR 1 homolog n=1 Tax=Olea europaea var. sylvestris TaxID=158386 RepID=UPI000C1CF186|nr:protein WHAT'S THIS FACTOR 1 homolog [Olea europaea var. sylvestris]XP_022897000.1 protein WHAT'S THIS FACTOR 1 homolog [Olea europaea var. sylvestris]XP_022897001.1 protein WHAT'S THIS FACTOR 1 homolog [Olea europaea var. sylvestris]XP_022897002.1 protein WHAT'S THIS FACTOR 1 homolog [Olea europaea var. sylvestris]XP_022897003.1 protein WHAT'S THIS FACTOR 1 homolog [Olea europaea var. sylvestris]XP_022897004.1 protein WHAT'S THIS FACTOR 1 homolog [Olea europaea var. sylvestris]XP_02289700